MSTSNDNRRKESLLEKLIRSNLLIFAIALVFAIWASVTPAGEDQDKLIGLFAIFTICYLLMEKSKEVRQKGVSTHPLSRDSDEKK